MTDKRDNRDTDTAAELVRLREENARLHLDSALQAGLAAGRAERTKDQLLSHEASFPVLDPEGPAMRRPLNPSGHVLGQHRANGSIFSMLWQEGSRGKRLIKVDAPSAADPTAGPWIKPHPDSLRRVVTGVLRGHIGEPRQLEELLAMWRGEFKPEQSTYGQPLIAGIYDAFFKKGGKVSHAIVTRLEKAIWQLQGLPFELARLQCVYWRELEPDETVPREWLDLLSAPWDSPVYEAEAIIPPAPREYVPRKPAPDPVGRY